MSQSRRPGTPVNLYWPVLLTVAAVGVSAVVVLAMNGARGLVVLPLMFGVIFVSLAVLAYAPSVWALLLLWFAFIPGAIAVTLLPRAAVSKDTFYLWLVTACALLSIWSDATQAIGERHFLRYAPEAKWIGDPSEGDARLPLRSFLPGIGWALVLCVLYGFVVPAHAGFPMRELEVNAGIGLAVGALAVLIAGRFSRLLCYAGLLIATYLLVSASQERWTLIVFTALAAHAVAMATGKESVYIGTPDALLRIPAITFTRPTKREPRQNAGGRVFDSETEARAYAASVPPLELSEMVVSIDPTPRSGRASLLNKERRYWLTSVVFEVGSERERMDIPEFSAAGFTPDDMRTDPAHVFVGTKPVICGGAIPDYAIRELRKQEGLAPTQLALTSADVTSIVATVHDDEVPALVEWLGYYVVA